MRLKQIVINGFKSYKDQTIVEPFHPGLNVVVGKNGSGKTNFFFAIRFVLADMYNNPKPEERKQLLHEGPGLALLTAYVEVTFDNSDNRFPIDSSEVVLRRTIGLKKDEYFLDRRHVSKADVMNLLESAGFSRSNPYYIVQQGKINSLTMMKDSERLNLLKEVAGTRVYDEKREESLKIMEDNDARCGQINEVLEYIEQRLGELEDEKEELKHYQELDRERRVVEYALYDHDLQAARTKLAAVEETREAEGRKSNQVYQDATRATNAMKAVEKELKLLGADIALATRERSALDDDRQESIRRRAQLELAVNDAQDRISAISGDQEQAAESLKTLIREIADTTYELEELRPQFKRYVDDEDAAAARLASAEREVDQLYTIQGRKKQFSNQRRRDEWIDKEIRSTDALILQNRNGLENLRVEVEALRNRIAEQEHEIASHAEKLGERKKLLERNSAEYTRKKIERDELANQRKELWREDSEVAEKLQQCKNELHHHERLLQGTMNKIVSQGISAVQRLARQHKLADRVYGPLIELISVERDEFAQSVEVTAGNSLFHIVVDTDETASQLLALLNREKAGRVTFMPLNRMRPPEVQYPVGRELDALPMISKLVFPEHIRPAVAQVFGKTLICRNLDVAASMAREFNLNCVTLEGDKVNNRGALTGGFSDTRCSRLDAMKHIKLHRRSLHELGATAAKLKDRITQTDQLVTQTLSELQSIESRSQRVRDADEHIVQEHRTMQKAIETMRSGLEEKEKMQRDFEATARELQDIRASREAEKGTELQSQLNTIEKLRLDELNNEIVKLKAQLKTLHSQRADAEVRKKHLETLLSSNLLPRKAELESSAAGGETRTAERELHTLRAEFESVSNAVEVTTARFAELDSLLTAKHERVRDAKARLEALRADELKLTRRIQDEGKMAEKLINKRLLLQQRIEDAMRKIRDLGSLPADAFE
eukprot:gnl/Spiro4/23446_TR11595_c0_g2_i2.p1 gnl/Spiro4/23446_TR11595_c0_g2~~gnl/Spiro4/23446_TR11595_c0_g2_i2.p1  ORF type:complete len:950 (+),score=268.79 gnl/Spiro4/23446_TR11595_c0_g2_i2:1039-3888(+)